MNTTKMKGLTAKEKTELNKKLKEKDLFLPIDKYNLYSLPDSKVHFDGVACDFSQLKEKTINLVKAKFNFKFDIDVDFNTENVEFYPLNQGSFFYNETVGYNELIKML